MVLVNAVIKQNNTQQSKSSSLVTLTSEKETEIFYRFYEIYHQVEEKEGLEVLPKIGEKEWKTPKKDKAIQITADEYNISTNQIRIILEKIEKRKPTDEEFRIFKIYDDKLNEAIDTEAAGGELVDEDKIRQEVVDSFSISQEKLKIIWARVYSWQSENKDVIQLPKVTNKLEQDTNNNLHISKSKYDFYYESYLKLSKLQDKYESTYTEFGKVGFDEMKNISNDEEFPNYGSIEREIVAINNSIPKYNSDMPSEELDIIIRLKEYSSALIFLTPQESEIDGIVFASGKRKIIKDLLDKTKTINGF